VANEHLFISDAHLGAHPPKQEQQVQQSLIKLIEYATRQKAKLYILGDLFDYWMEFPNSEIRPHIGDEVLTAFNTYHKLVGASLFITGNHDNWTLGYFDSLGFDVEPNFRLVSIFDRQIHLMHGDGLWESDNSLKRPFMHRILRSNSFLSVYRNILPNKIALSLMQSFSNTTRKIDRRDPAPLNENAKLILDRTEADIVLTGHDHIPRVETFNSGLYINLGTFFHHCTLVRGFEHSFELVQWDSASSTFTSFEKYHQHS
jgi:UDP-2,3-diacylglucosamine pyrophosphatase LpxH